MKIVNFNLFRKPIEFDYIRGELYGEQGRICQTLENALHHLPTGKYHIDIGKCNFRGRKMPMILITDGEQHTSRCRQCQKPDSVSINTCPHKSKGENLLFCPQLTPGNGVSNRTDGSILVGDDGSYGILLHPKEVFDRLYDILRKSSERGHQIVLTIQNSYSL